ncbi:putative ATP synthase YscN [Rosistilla carotiformis]|uniref:Putative ATP synthase YscN n=1 Tax=Rosistilla carotiformis TaxID=2528017 RepID=A0A518JN17_9BACT|nr:FliI/YscN family ATPase [Rosistilla carotiformis]QDV66932.1 putative ATP synthase YscN [Rosistilla carotiformis]
MKNAPFPELVKAEDYRQTIRNAINGRVVGSVHAIVGNRVEVRGLSVPVGSICTIHTRSGQKGAAKVIGFRDDSPILAVMDELSALSSGDPVELQSHSVNLRLGEGLIGRVVDALGRPLDGRPLPASLTTTSINMEPPASLDRPPIETVFETGIRSIDGLLTCGLGQRLGIFAGAGGGKSTLMGMLAKNSKADAVVIGLIGERGREVREFIEHTLGKEGMARSTLVVSTNDQPATMRIQAAWTATAIATALRDQGKNVVLLMDSITRFATAQREIGLAVGEPPTTRGYPPSVFSTLPKLVEQSGRTERGSITAFYAVLVDGDDNNEPISDNLRGLLDGHFILSRKLGSEGHWPAIDVLESLSRLQTKLIPAKSLAAATQLRKWLANYRTNEDLINIGAYRAGTNPDLDKTIEMQPMVRQFLVQKSNEVSPLGITMKAMQTLAG